MSDPTDTVFHLTDDWPANTDTWLVYEFGEEPDLEALFGKPNAPTESAGDGYGDGYMLLSNAGVEGGDFVHVYPRWDIWRIASHGTGPAKRFIDWLASKGVEPVGRVVA